MNKTLYLTSILILGFCLPTGYAMGQAAEEKDVAEIATEQVEKESEVAPPPTRLPSYLPRSTLALDPKRKMLLLALQFSNSKVHWLNDGTSDFLAIWQEDRSGDARGALLILHAEGEHPSWPQTTQPLHDSLPEYGWATMAIQLPNSAAKKRPERTLAAKIIPPRPNRDITNENADNNQKNEEAKQEDGSKADKQLATTKNKTFTKTVEDIEVIAEKRLTAAIKFLHDKGQFNIVLVGNGTGAIRSHKLIKSIVPNIEDKRLKKKIKKPIRGSVIFNARNKLPSETNIYREWFFDPEIPILDIYVAHDIRNQRDAKIRQAMSKRAKAVSYKQIKITELSYEKSWKENQLSRRIRSFLDTYSQGIEVYNPKAAKR